MELDPEARRILALARAARTPSAMDKARVARRLGLAVGASAAASALALGHTAKAAGSAKTATGLLLLKWGLGTGALIGVAALGFVSLSGTPPAVRREPVREATAVSVLLAGGAARFDQVAQPVVPAAVPEPAAAEPAPEHERPSQSPRLHPRAARGAAPAQPLADLSVEVALLHRAQEAWRSGQPQQALSLLSEHQTRFPRSGLDLERDGLRVLTLCELGHEVEARQLARSVLSRAPHSPLRASIEESCASKRAVPPASKTMR